MTLSEAGCPVIAQACDHPPERSKAATYSLLHKVVFTHKSSVIWWSTIEAMLLRLPGSGSLLRNRRVTCPRTPCLRLPSQFSRGIAPQAFILQPAGDGSVDHLDEGQAPAEPFGPFLLGPGTYEVGRGPNANLRLTLPTVSSRHALLLISQDDVLMVTDLKSTNGTTVNGMELEPLQPFEVMSGSTITFGDPYLAKFTLDQVFQEDQTQLTAWPDDGSDVLSSQSSAASELAVEDELYYAAAPGLDIEQEAAVQAAGGDEPAEMEAVAVAEDAGVAEGEVQEVHAGHGHEHGHTGTDGSDGGGQDSLEVVQSEAELDTAESMSASSQPDDSGSSQPEEDAVSPVSSVADADADTGSAADTDA